MQLVIRSRLHFKLHLIYFHHCFNAFINSLLLQNTGRKTLCLQTRRGLRSRPADINTDLLISNLWVAVLFPFSVQRMSLGGKWGRNMINRGCGCVARILSNAVNPCLARRVRDSALRGGGGGGGGGGGRGGVCSSVVSHWGGGGGGGGKGSREGCCWRDHQSRRIIITKNKGMVFSSLSNEFLWVSFYPIIFRGESTFYEICSNHPLNYVL